jgi:hypothetical protein
MLIHLNRQYCFVVVAVVVVLEADIVVAADLK